MRVTVTLFSFHTVHFTVAVEKEHTESNNSKAYSHSYDLE